MGGMDHGREVFGELWPGARAVSDETLRFYRGFRLKRGSAGEIFGWRTFVRAFQAWKKGFRQKKAGPDPWMMPGAFLVRGPEIIWQHRYRHAGDEPDFSTMPRESAGPA